MGVKRLIKNTARKGFNVKKWVGYDHLKSSGQTVGGMAEDLYSMNKKKPVINETFEQAVKRQGLSEKDIKNRMKTAYQFSVACALATPLFLLYAIYLFIATSAISGVVAFLMAVLLGAYAYRESFNYFQMKQRRLGCTVQEWFNATFKGKK